MTFSQRAAEDVIWCQVVDGIVHAARWTPYNEGCLTTLIEDDEGADIECHQTVTSFAELRERGRPWSDRNLLGATVCAACEADVQDETETMEWWDAEG